MLKQTEIQPLTQETKDVLAKIANTIRALTMDATQKANSGHPGLPLGCAEIGAYLYGYGLKHNPKNSHWINRDRFILSAGHGCMLLYSCLHLAGFNLSLDEIKRFRQLNSQTPGHPEKHDTDGVETTTGPLGQGVGNAVGQALGLKLLGEKFNTENETLFSNKVFCLAGDGCMMEGVSSEASALAGHLKLDNLILLYDANDICLDGPISECWSENTKMRYHAYDWDVYEIDGHNFDQIHATLSSIRTSQTKPCLVICRTIIAKGAPTKAGTHKAHGSPLGEEEVKATKKALGIAEEEFYIPNEVTRYFQHKLINDMLQEEEWKKTFERWSRSHPNLKEQYEVMWKKTIPQDLEQKLDTIPLKSPLAGRQVSQAVVEYLGTLLPYLYGGSADLSCSDLTMMKQFPVVSPDLFNGRNIKFGVREFAMGTIAIGMEQSQMIIPYVGTFLTFSDYMRNSIRLACLQHTHIVYQFTHDSIFLGEDGPTHQPVEHYAALRAIPNIHFIRPADHHEVKKAWLAALYYQGPTVIALSRQNLPELQETNIPYNQGLGRGAYIVKKEKKKATVTLVATGSELSLALDVAKRLEGSGEDVRVISMPCWQIYEKQEPQYKKEIFGGDLGLRVSIEAGVDQGWHKYIGLDGVAICMESFGLSAPMKDLQKVFGFNVDAIVERIMKEKNK